MSEESRLGGAAWNQLRDDVLERDGHRCADCGTEENLQVHHVVPLSHNGTNRTTNLLTVRRTCHHGAHGRSARAEIDDTNPDRVRWLPTIKDVRRLARLTPRPLKQAIIVLLAKTGLGAGEVYALLLEGVALADADRRDTLDLNYPAWAGGTSSYLRIHGRTVETRRPSRRERSETTIVPLDRELCRVLVRWLAVRPDPITDSPSLFARSGSGWGTPLSIDNVHHLVESCTRPWDCTETTVSWIIRRPVRSVASSRSTSPGNQPLANTLPAATHPLCHQSNWRPTTPIRYTL